MLPPSYLLGLWLRSSVVSVLISLISDRCSMSIQLINPIFMPGLASGACTMSGCGSPIAVSGDAAGGHKLTRLTVRYPSRRQFKQWVRYPSVPVGSSAGGRQGIEPRYHIALVPLSCYSTLIAPSNHIAVFTSDRTDLSPFTKDRRGGNTCMRLNLFLPAERR